MSCTYSNDAFSLQMLMNYIFSNLSFELFENAVEPSLTGSKRIKSKFHHIQELADCQRSS